ncbi:hypothetical protein BJF79_09575 [Actinomadura sp. CNU-125]|uniref:tyrosine-type recombinase/integrase n=1 Tax=Actinomadura sp. CNU-125 TaxID=1904961 RepID=UPI00095A975C|nr:tyrosine-type recombinase/integrase [Actinomadura sp. CNU-125]OLT30488.1 hypothetical protein BJF79_09575 [Actinomadura sp. CNU-125]
MADHPDRRRHLRRQTQNRSRRATITLDSTTIKVLRSHKAQQNTERLAAGDAWGETGYVFTTPDGRPLRPNEVTEQFEQLSMETGLPPIRLHDLRHGAATFLLAAGHDMKVVQETLRLSSLAIASDIYTSVLPQLARQSAEDAAAIVLTADTGRPRQRGAAITGLPDRQKRATSPARRTGTPPGNPSRPALSPQ